MPSQSLRKSADPREAAAASAAVTEASDGWAAWEKLRSGVGQDDPILSAAFLSAWLASFGPESAGPVMIADEIAVLAERTVERPAGLPVRVWRLCVNDHSIRAPVLYRPGREREAGLAFVAFLRQRRHTLEALRLRGLPLLLADAVADAARDAGMVVDLDFRRCQVGLNVGGFGNFAAYLDTRGASTQRTLRKQTTRLHRLGRLHVTVAAGEGLRAGLADYMAVEARSWKSQRGEILASSARVEAFYRGLLDGFGRRGEARVWCLRLDDQVIASAITLHEGGRCLTLKLTFDEAFEAHSPGRQLLQRVIEQQFQSDCRMVDFFSGMETWRYWSSLEWTFQDVTVWSDSARGRFSAFARRGLHAVKARIAKTSDRAALPPADGAARKAPDGL